MDDRIVLCDLHFVGVGGTKINSASFCGEKIGGKHVRFCKSRTGGVSLDDKTGLDGVGLGGGNGTSKVGAGRSGGGLGEEYDDQEVGKVRRSEEGYGNGEKVWIHRRT